MDGHQSKRIEDKILKFNTIFSNKYPLPLFLDYLVVKVPSIVANPETLCLEKVADCPLLEFHG